MSLADISIKLGADFTGRKAFTDAQKATSSLETSVHRLGKQFATVFSAYKFAQFGKSAAKAFMEDQQAAKVLAANLRSIGYGDAAAGAEQFIAAMEKTTGVADSKLRPAYAQLARVTGSLSQTQKILNTAWNVSAGTGADISQVVDALSQAYVGNTKGLKSLNTGLTAAELSSKNFSQIMDTLNQQFGGAGAASLNSYAGQLSLLQVAGQNAMETIGQSIIDTFSILNGSEGIGATIDLIDSAANKFADFVRLIGASVGVIKSALNPKTWFNMDEKKKEIDKIIDEFNFKQGLANQKRMFHEWIPSEPWTPEQKKAAALAAARAKQLADLIKKQNAAQTELNKKKADGVKLDALSAKYKQDESIFNMESIELAAAAMSRQTAEDYARIKLKQDLITLQTAIQNNDVAAAQAASKVVDEDLKRVQAYQAINIAAGIQSGLITNIKTASSLIPNNLNLFNIDNLQSALDYIKQIIASLGKVATTTTTSPAATAVAIGAVSSNIVTPASIGLTDAQVTAVQQAAISAKMASAASLGLTDAQVSAMQTLPPVQNIVTARSLGLGDPIVNITITDNAKNLVDVVMDTTQQQSASGIPTQITRNAKNLAW